MSGAVDLSDVGCCRRRRVNVNHLMNSHVGAEPRDPESIGAAAIVHTHTKTER